MRVITVLNRCTEFKRFVFEGSHLDEQGRIIVRLRPPKNSLAACSGCGRLSPTYDTAAEARRFEFVPLWEFPGPSGLSHASGVLQSLRSSGGGGRSLEHGQASPV